MSRTEWERKAPQPSYTIPVPEENPSVTEMGLRAENNCLKRELDELKKENAELRKKVAMNQKIMTYLEDSAGYVRWLIQCLEGKEDAEHD